MARIAKNIVFKIVPPKSLLTAHRRLVNIKMGIDKMLASVHSPYLRSILGTKAYISFMAFIKYSARNLNKLCFLLNPEFKSVRLFLFNIQFTHPFANLYYCICNRHQSTPTGTAASCGFQVEN